MLEKWTIETERQAGLPAGESPTAPGLVDFQRERALLAVGGDEDLLIEVIGIFLGESPRLLNEIEQAIDAADYSTVARLAHSLRGATSNFALNSVQDSASRLERNARTGSSAQLRSDLNDLKLDLDRVRPCLEAVAAGAH